MPSLARGLNRHPLIASGIHRAAPANLSALLAVARRNGDGSDAGAPRSKASSAGRCGSRTSPNKRTLYNFPMQADGAEMLRLAAWRLCEAGIVPVMLIHDGILLEETDREQIEHAKEIMRTAGRDVCDGFEIGVDVDQLLIGGARYSDKRPMARKMWATIMAALEAVKAVSRRA